MRAHMRSSLLPLALFAFLAGCSASSSPATGAGESAVTAAAPTPAGVDAQAALVAMKAAVTGTRWPLLVEATPSGTLATRFGQAKTAVESFAFAHADLGNNASEIAYVLSAPGASTFVGYAVFAFGGDDAEFWSSRAAAYYSTEGELLDVVTTSAGVADGEDAGHWAGVDEELVAKERQALEGAITFDANAQTVAVTAAKTVPAKADALPFATLVKKLQIELEASTFAHADQGNTVTKLVGLEDAAGTTLGYILTSEGGDDADDWKAAGYALFSAQGQLVGRQIATAGRADNMTNDSVR